jgi:hypothetical protein
MKILSALRIAALFAWAAFAIYLLWSNFAHAHDVTTGKTDPPTGYGFSFMPLTF